MLGTSHTLPLPLSHSPTLPLSRRGPSPAPRRDGPLRPPLPVHALLAPVPEHRPALDEQLVSPRDAVHLVVRLLLLRKAVHLVQEPRGARPRHFAEEHRRKRV